MGKNGKRKEGTNLKGVNGTFNEEQLNVVRENIQERMEKLGFILANSSATHIKTVGAIIQPKIKLDQKVYRDIANIRENIETILKKMGIEELREWYSKTGSLIETDYDCTLRNGEASLEKRAQNKDAGVILLPSSLTTLDQSDYVRILAGILQDENRTKLDNCDTYDALPAIIEYLFHANMNGNDKIHILNAMKRSVLRVQENAREYNAVSSRLARLATSEGFEGFTIEQLNDLIKSEVAFHVSAVSESVASVLIEGPLQEDPIQFKGYVSSVLSGDKTVADMVSHYGARPNTEVLIVKANSLVKAKN